MKEKQLEAMEEKMDSMDKNKVWELVDLIIGLLMVFISWYWKLKSNWIKLSLGQEVVITEVGGPNLLFNARWFIRSKLRVMELVVANNHKVSLLLVVESVSNVMVLGILLQIVQIEEWLLWWKKKYLKKKNHEDGRELEREDDELVYADEGTFLIIQK